MSAPSGGRRPTRCAAAPRRRPRSRSPQLASASEHWCPQALRQCAWMRSVPHSFTSRSASIAIGSVMKFDALPDVEAGAAGTVRVGVVHQATEVLAATPPGPRLLDGLAVLTVTSPNQPSASAVRSHQPLVGRADHRRQDVPRRTERRALRPTGCRRPRPTAPTSLRPRRQPRQVEPRAVGPVHVPDRQHRRALRRSRRATPRSRPPPRPSRRSGAATVRTSAAALLRPGAATDGRCSETAHRRRRCAGPAGRAGCERRSPCRRTRSAAPRPARVAACRARPRTRAFTCSTSVKKSAAPMVQGRCFRAMPARPASSTECGSGDMYAQFR